MLVYADSDAREAFRRQPQLDRERVPQLTQKLFPGERLEQLEDGWLYNTCPGDDELSVGCFPGVSIVAAKEFGIDYPSTLSPAFINAAGNGKLILHAMHSMVDWFAFAMWSNRELVRSLSVCLESGILENIGQPLPFEVPYWAGQHPVFDNVEDGLFPLPFHPLELGEAALGELVGYYIEGRMTDVDPESIPLIRYKRA